MKVTVFGTGYVGLVQGAVLADVGHHVLCIDVDEAKVAALRAGRIPIHEPGLDALVRAGQAAGRLRFSTDAAEGVALRATFIVDPDNVIQHVSVNNLNVGRNPDEILRILDGLQTDELCPCNRSIGGTTL